MTRRSSSNDLSVKSLLMAGGASVALAVSLGVPSIAYAQDDDDDKDVIVITGFRSSIQNSVGVKRNSSSIVEAVSAEDIGKLPDVSIAESLARLPGLATQRVDGRSQVLSIRGLGPDFSTALLNGREQVSAGDNRGVEFDQYPAELLSSAVVYKTPYAGLIGQGLVGTVDLRTIRPLEKGERIISANARYEFNENGSLNPDSPGDGFRTSMTIVDQFADDTVGIAIGLAYQSTPTQVERFEAWGYPTAYRDLDGNITGADRTQTAGQATPDDTSDDVYVDHENLGLVIGGAKPFVESNDLDRFGIVGIFEYEPNDNFSTAVDLYYSDFDEVKVRRGVELPLFWSAAQLQEGFTSEDGFINSGVYDNVVGVMRNDLNIRKAELFAGGWNARYETESWGLEFDVSYSRAERSDELIESYSGTGYATSGTKDSIGFAFADNGRTVFAPSLDYSDISQFVLTDPQGWGGAARVQAGFINAPTTEDELWHLKASADQALNASFLKSVEVGIDYGMRDKQRDFVQNYLVLPGGATETAIPQEALLGETTGTAFVGFPAQVTYDPRYLLDNGFYDFELTMNSSVSQSNSWRIEEDTIIGWVKFDLEGELGSLPFSGNMGAQIVHTDQSSTGSRVEVEAGGFVITPIQDGDKYTDVLPSINLIFDLGEDTKLRLGAARTLARARMDKLNASLDVRTNIVLLTANSPATGDSFFSAEGGNPLLRPYIANGVDMSLEHYFGLAGYISIAGFYKDLEDYVFDGDSFIGDFSQFVDVELSPAQQALLGTTQGLVSGPTNRGKGHIKGFEVGLSLPGENLFEALEGFGLITSGSFTDSEVLLGDNTSPITVPGLSKWVVNTTLYFERNGFEARISQRYRSQFLSEVFGISATREFRQAKAESIFDAQVGYNFQSGPFEGLRITAQGLNLTDEPFVTFDRGDQRLTRNHESFGRTFLIGASYTF